MSGRSGWSAGIIVAAACAALAPLCAGAAEAAVPAHAVPPEGAPPPAAASTSAGIGAAAVEPPRLLVPVEPVYPEEARAERVEGVVGLRLSIDAQGRVTGAEVVEPAGHGFDESARAAALRFTFSPAKRGGQPVPSRIRYAFEFHLPPLPPPVEAPPSNDPVVPPPAPAPQAASTEIDVRGALDANARLQQSADAVTAIDLHRAQQESRDLGAVMARTQGITVRRAGGLGSDTQFSLDGLQGEQIRFFLDGVPLDLAGYPFEVANVPVNLIERIEVYRGVVPIRLGADALGGAVNLVTDEHYDSHLGASYQIGSFKTHRLTLDGRHRDEGSGFVIGGNAYLDLAKNDYDVDVEVPSEVPGERGRPIPVTVPRFHDGYRAYGVAAEAGWVDRPWARKLLLRGTAVGYHKELQNNTVMSVAYGDVTYGEEVYSGTLRYEQPLRQDLELEVLGNYARRVIHFQDDSPWVYDWYGNRIRQRPVTGYCEIEGIPHDQIFWQNGLFGRAQLKWSLPGRQFLRLAVTPRYTTRTGDERDQASSATRDPLSARSNLLTLVSGVEYELNLFGDRLQNVAFVKHYLYRARAEEVLPGNIFRPLAQDRSRFGGGDALRLFVTRWLYAKVSYEYATRLPDFFEVFGNGVLIHPNLHLEPEVSHNVNVGPRVELRDGAAGDLTLDVQGFWRDTDRQIVLLGNDQFFTYQNVFRTSGLGLNNALEWFAPGRWASLEGTLTWQELRNRSTEGTFRGFNGDRIPNRPWLFATWGGRLRFAQFLGRLGDALEPFYAGQYIHWFFRGWESQGLVDTKQRIPTQVTHNLGLTWSTEGASARMSATLEVQNFTNAKVFDDFGVQKPGRAYYLKLTGDLW